MEANHLSSIVHSTTTITLNNNNDNDNITKIYCRRYCNGQPVGD